MGSRYEGPGATLGLGHRRGGGYDVGMATNRASDAANEIEDPIHEEVRLVMADPRVKARLDAWEERKRRGEFLPRVSHNEARRIVGLPPLPGWD